jgi:Zn-dependent M28 family amino/carboxypeptidase
LKAAGVIGTIGISNPKLMDIPWERSMQTRLRPQMRLADKALDESAGWDVQLSWNPAKAAVLFEGSGHTLAELLAVADAKQPLPRFPLHGTLETRTAMSYSPVESFNIVAKLPGSDPVLKNEYIVLSAHMDHIGINDAGTDRINNGAIDNASGTAMLLQVSDLLKKSNTRPKRSILFVFVTAEEKGLLGSRYFAMNPTVPKKALAANINIDMFLPINPPDKIIVRGMAESDLGDWARESVKSVGAEPILDPEPQRNSFIRSDQYNFIRQGVPAVVMTIGYGKGTPEEKVVHQWLKERYHAPGDDLAQPINFEAAKKYEEILAALLTRAANADKRPEWHKDSFFRRFTKYHD